MDDPQQLELQPPLPGDALAATVTFQAARGGLAPGYRTVPRSEATHAELRITGLSGRTDERRVELAEADAWLAEARALRDRGERLDAAARERRERDAAEVEQLAATIDLDCPRCGIPRAHGGRHHLMTAGAPEHLGATGEYFAKTRPSAIVVDEYVCPRCGSVELFRPRLPHPLGG